MKNTIIYIVLAYSISVNLGAYFIMWIDKKRALKGAWRIKEKTIFVYALFGGFAGVWLAMNSFRHKTKTWYFVWGIPAIAALWMGIIGLIVHQFM